MKEQVNHGRGRARTILFDLIFKVTSEIDRNYASRAYSKAKKYVYMVSNVPLTVLTQKGKVSPFGNVVFLGKLIKSCSDFIISIEYEVRVAD